MLERWVSLTRYELLALPLDLIIGVIIGVISARRDGMRRLPRLPYFLGAILVGLVLNVALYWVVVS